MLNNTGNAILRLSRSLCAVMQHNLTHYSGTAYCSKYELGKSQVVPLKVSFIIHHGMNSVCLR